MENTNLTRPTADILERMDFIISALKGIKTADYNDEQNALADEQEKLWDSYDFHDYIFQENGLVGLKNCKGLVRIPARYTGISDCREYGSYGYESVIPVVGTDGKVGFVDIHGIEVCSCKYDGAEVFDFENFIVTIGNKVGLVDTEGNEVVGCFCDDIYQPFGMVKILEADEGLYGLYTSRNGGVMVPCVFGSVEEKNGCVYVSASGTWGYVDTKGHFIPETDSLGSSELMRFGVDVDAMP